MTACFVCTSMLHLFPLHFIDIQLSCKHNFYANKQTSFNFSNKETGLLSASIAIALAVFGFSLHRQRLFLKAKDWLLCDKLVLINPLKKSHRSVRILLHYFPSILLRTIRPHKRQVSNKFLIPHYHLKAKNHVKSSYFIKFYVTFRKDKTDRF